MHVVRVQLKLLLIFEEEAKVNLSVLGKNCFLIEGLWILLFFKVFSEIFEGALSNLGLDQFGQKVFKENHDYDW